MSAFLILGHGTENPINFEKRSKIPKGITLVTLAKCGYVTYQKQICPAIQAFTKKEFETFFLNPKTHRKSLNAFMKDKLHVYTENDYYPSLNVQLFSNFSNAESNGWGRSIRLFKSGLYKFPITEEDFNIYNGEYPGPKTIFCDRAYASADVGWGNTLQSSFNLNSVYKGSIFPTPEQAQEIRSTNGTIENMKKAFTYPLETIFEKGGPGVYYYLVCRSPKNITDIYHYVTEELKPKNISPYEEFFHNNWISEHEKFIPLLKKELEGQNAESWRAESLRTIIKKYNESLSKIPKIRRNSIAQQESKTANGNTSATGAGAGEGGGKTRRKNKKFRKTRRR